MSRFNNLEFGDDAEKESASQPLVKDELYYQQEAQTEFESGNFERALRSYAKVLEHNPQNPVAWTGQVRMLIELGEFREAKLWADKALEQLPHEPELLAAKAVALARIGDIKNALAFSDAAMEERGDTSYVWLARGDVLLAAKRRQARFCIEQAVSRARGWFVHWLASRIYYYYSKFSLALQMAQQGLAFDVSRSALWLQMGYCQVALGLTEIAAESFEQVRQLDPNNREIAEALLESAQVGRVTRFFRSLRRIVRL
ncbi:MAG TPA: tetratricopeptide repeat protein [Verrucomicrobiae bacterium]|nr:tetratricopeptide repeat protein [Verrucomicrobiae bacterium]